MEGELLESFLEDLWDALQSFEETLAICVIDFEGVHLQKLQLLAHRVRGTAALYGYPQLSKLALLGERLLENTPQALSSARDEILMFLDQLLTCARSALEHISEYGTEGPVGLELNMIEGGRTLRNLLTQHPEAVIQKINISNNDSGSLREQFSRFRRENPDIWSFFEPEAQEHLNTIEASMENILHYGLDEENLTLLFRAMHTLKGSAYMVELQPMGDLAHELEDILVGLREGGEVWTPNIAKRLHDGTNELYQMLMWAEEERPHAQTVSAAGVVMPKPAAPAQQQRNIRVSLAKLDRLVSLSDELVSARAMLSQQLDNLRQLHTLLIGSHQRLQKVVIDFEEKYLNPTLSPARPSQEVRLSLEERFAELEFDSYSDLNILARSVTEMSSDLGELNTLFARQLNQFGEQEQYLQKLSRDLRQEVGQSRMVSLDTLYTRVARSVRDSGHLLETVGGEIELDNGVLERLGNPLIHLLKNSVAHGIEAADIRQKRGKPVQGKIRLVATLEGNSVYLRVEDDGGGIDIEAVKQKAFNMGSHNLEELAEMTPEQCFELIFLPGLSTASQITTEAGRGVGMDAVQSEIRQLGGSIQIESHVGKGTSFILRLPLTLAISDVLLCLVGDDQLGIPTRWVRRVELIPREEVQLNNQDHWVFQGGLVPLYNLPSLLNIAWDVPDEVPVIFLELGDLQMGFAVSGFIGLEEVVQKPLPNTLAHFPYLAGVALSARGQVIPLLDPLGARALDPSVVPARPKVTVQRKHLLLVDDSLSVRRVVGQMLERGGYEVTTANDGQDALDRLRENPHFDAILTDLEMPRLNGYELLEALQGAKIQKPVVVMTTRAGEKHRDLAFQLGAQAYFSKPIEEGRLLRFLSEI